MATDRRAAYLASGVFGLGLGLVGPSLPSLRATFAISYGVAALHLTLFSCGSLLGAAATGRLEDRHGRAATARLALAVLGAGAAAVGLAPSALASLLGAFVAGAGAAVVANSANATLGEQDGRRATTDLTNGQVAAAVGMVAAAALVALAQPVPGPGWRLAWAAPALGGALLVARRVPRRLAPPASAAPGPSRPTVDGTGGGAASRSTRRAGPSRAVVLAVVVVGIAVATEITITFWAATYLTDALGLSATGALVATACTLVGLVVGRVVVARLTTSRGSVPLLRGATMVVLVAAVPYVGGPLLGGGAAVPVTLTALLVLCLAAAALFPLALALAMTVADPQRQARASAAALSAGSVAGMSTPVVLGWVADATSLGTAMLAVPVGAAATLVLVGAAQRARDAGGPGGAADASGRAPRASTAPGRRG